jgi:O-antigen ligase
MMLVLLAVLASFMFAAMQFSGAQMQALNGIGRGRWHSWAIYHRGRRFWRKLASEMIGEHPLLGRGYDNWRSRANFLRQCHDTGRAKPRPINRQTPNQSVTGHLSLWYCSPR